MTDNHSDSNRVVKYHDDNFDYAYSNFWQGRDYDHQSEILILKKYFKKYIRPNNYPWITDIGGNFGRLIPMYATSFSEVAVVDYADNQFHIAQQTADKEGIKLHLIAANAYYLPLADNSQPVLISVRLIHHLENPKQFFQEISRTLHSDGFFIFQASNKNHIGLWLKSCIKFNFSDWRLNWTDLGRSGHQTDGSFLLIRNYKFNYLEELIKANNLKIVRKRSVSWLRSFGWARRYYRFSFIFERILQRLSFILPLSSNNWYVLQKGNREQSSTKQFAFENFKFLANLYSFKQKKKISQKDCIQFLNTNDNGVKFLDFRDL